MIFKAFKVMDQEAARKALEGHPNVLKSAVEEHQKKFKSLKCPACGGSCMPFVDATRPFVEGEILPNYLARCTSCGVEFDPHTGIQLTIPKPSKVTF